MSSRPKDGISALKDVKTKEDTSSDSEDKMAAINKNLAFGKRKPELLIDGGEVVEKRKKGRPRKDKMSTTNSQPFTQVERWREKMNEQMECLEVSMNWYIIEFQAIQLFLYGNMIKRKRKYIFRLWRHLLTL